MTPVAASMKLHRFVGAASQVMSVVFRLRGSVAIRSAVMRQMKKPIEKRTTRPIRAPKAMLRRTMTGIGSMKIAMSVNRFNIALVQLERGLALGSSVCACFAYRCQAKLMHVPGTERSYARDTGVH